MSSSNDPELHQRPDAFPNTLWSEVVAAANHPAPSSKPALENLCSRYWVPLYSYIRRNARDRDEAEDLTQAFFSRLLQKGYLTDYRRERGKFRTFLLACLKHFLANERDWASAQKRGGGKPELPLEFDINNAEQKLLYDPPDNLTPEVLYERQWAFSVVARVQARMEREFERGGRSRHFAQLRAFITDEDNPLPYREIAASLGISEGSLKVTVHRLRRRFRELLRDEILQTVLSQEEAQEELGFLMSVLRH